MVIGHDDGSSRLIWLPYGFRSSWYQPCRQRFGGRVESAIMHGVDGSVSTAMSPLATDDLMIDYRIKELSRLRIQLRHLMIDYRMKELSRLRLKLTHLIIGYRMKELSRLRVPFPYNFVQCAPAIPAGTLRLTIAVPTTPPAAPLSSRAGCKAENLDSRLPTSAGRGRS